MSPETPECVSVFDRPAHLKDRYRRLVLVSHQHHVEQLHPDEDTLIVSCDWLLWQKCLAQKRHCVMFEEGILAWQEPDSLDEDIHLRSTDWVYVGGQDVTSFRGVSLGKLFAPDVLVFMAGYIFLERSLGKLIEKYLPREVVAFDFFAELNSLDDATRRFLVADVTEKAGVALVERWDTRDPEDPALPMHPEAVFSRGPGRSFRAALRAMALFVYSRWVGSASRAMRFVGKHRDCVIFLVNTNISNPLIDAYSRGHVQPAFMFESQNKQPAKVLNRLLRGILLVSRPVTRLGHGDRTRLHGIVSALEDAWSQPAEGLTEAVRRHVRRYFVETGRITALAREVLAAEGIIDAYRPVRIVVDGVRNAPPRIYVELAHGRNISVDYTWHAPMDSQNLKFDALGMDPRCPPMVERCLSWGSINDRWCRDVGAQVNCVRTGTPIQSRYAGAKAPSGASSAGKRILVLDYNALGEDLKAIHGCRYDFFVRVVRLLTRSGYKDIRFKLHPGRPSKEYYEEIARYFNLSCRVYKHEPFGDVLEDSDVVIGPAFTGARLEALAAGKAYVPFLIPPHAFATRFSENEKLLTDVEQLPAVLAQEAFEDAEEILDAYCSTATIPDAAKRIWQVLESDAS